MWQLDRDRIWRAAWLLLPVAVVLDLLIGRGFESSSRLQLHASAYGSEGRWEEAAERFERAAQADPEGVLAAYNAAVAWSKLGDEERARYWLREARRRDESFAPAREALASLRPHGS